MATREIMVTAIAEFKSSTSAFNISAPVGSRAKNNRGDVTLIQAFFTFLRSGMPEKFGEMPKIREVNGYFDSVTDHAIRWYQNEYSFLMMRRDGIVHPASLKNRIIRREGKHMMIYSLNQHAMLVSIARHQSIFFTEKMFQDFPQLKLWVRDV